MEEHPSRERNPHFQPSPQHQDQQKQPQYLSTQLPPSGQPPQPSRQPLRHGGVSGTLKVPNTRRKKPVIWFTTWFGAVCCAIFWIIIILTGLAILIVYLAFRPRSPHFDISSVTLDAAYIDTGSLLNADLTILTNFTNPNKKVNVDFSFMVLQLYYEDTLIATRAIDPFSVTSMETRLHNVEMISSQVSLPIDVSETLRKQMGGNAVIFNLQGTFRTRSNFGSFFHYTYWVYSKCTIVTTGPPSGVLIAHKCRKKR
ncbi:NDR1/HIN1-like protein 3 [Macadamia integrifolia]|uniref:NDR1/HIN1-like protein 3 n=1 Tax=Macadamia integrifolia TaxID=60698 RepID=UPI001C4E4005|nr:NDR1/HIN1-like protein 3 [Macadamia integrifolia]